MDLIALLKSQFLCHLIFCYVFIASGLIINTIQLFTLLLWPINKQLFRKINCRLSYCISSRKRLSPVSLFASSLPVCVCVTIRTSYMGSLRLLVYAKILWFVSVCCRFEMSILSSLLKNYFLNE